MDAGASIVAFIQLAAGIFEGSIQAYEMWHRIKGIPAEVEDVLKKVKLYGTMFEDIRANLEADASSRFDFRSSGSVHYCFEAANSARESLQELTQDMNSEITAKTGLRKTVKLTKLFIKRDKLEQYQKKLSQSVDSLKMALDIYQREVTRRLPETLARRVTAEVMAEMKPLLESATKQRFIADTKHRVDDDDELQNPDSANGNALVRASKPTASATRSYAPTKLGRYTVAYQKTSGAWQAYLQMPSWLSQSVYQLTSIPGIGGRTLIYRMYNIVPGNSEIIQRVEKGDKDGVNDLFNTGKASPYDRDSSGSSLLYHAARSKKYGMCELLLKYGLKDCLLEDGQWSPISQFVFWPRSTKKQSDKVDPEDRWERIVDLFHRHLEDPESNLVLKLFDHLQEWAYGDQFVLTFRERFLPKWYTGPLTNRLQAFRYGSFIMKCPSKLIKLLDDDSKVSSTDVQMSTHQKLSLVHSVAIALSARFADENLPYKRVWLQGRKYHEGWSDLAQQVAAVSSSEDLHAIETITPWDVHHVPVWRGTPLVSVIGGALCYISPNISFTHWDMTFQSTLRQWVLDLQEAGVDLVEYGRKESTVLKTQARGALDGDAIDASRNVVRDTLAQGVESLKGNALLGLDYNENHWVPVRILDLEYGEKPADWRIVWAPEFEWMAGQFWKLVEKEIMVMPGSWVEV